MTSLLLSLLKLRIHAAKMVFSTLGWEDPEAFAVHFMYHMILTLRLLYVDIFIVL